MRISTDRFSEILSAYFDGEASESEMELLSKCIRGNAYFAGMFLDYCKIQMATCELYSGSLSKDRLDEFMNYAVATLSRRVEISNEPFGVRFVKFARRWALTASLMLLCAFFAFLAFSKGMDSAGKNNSADMLASAGIIVSPSEEMKVGDDGQYCSSALFIVNGQGLRVLFKE